MHNLDTYINNLTTNYFQKYSSMIDTYLSLQLKLRLTYT